MCHSENKKSYAVSLSLTLCCEMGFSFVKFCMTGHHIAFGVCRRIVCAFPDLYINIYVYMYKHILYINNIMSVHTLTIHLPLYNLLHCSAPDCHGNQSARLGVDLISYGVCNPGDSCLVTEE